MRMTSTESAMLAPLMIGIGIAGALLLVAIIRRHRADWNLSSSLVFGVAWIVNAPSLINGLTGRYIVRYDDFQRTNVRVLLGEHLTIYAYLVLSGTILAGALIVTRIGRGRLQPSALVAVVLGFLMNYMNGYNGTSAVTRGGIFLALVLMAASTLTPGRGAWLGAGTFGISLAVASSVFTAFQPEDGSGFCLQQKCGPLGVLIVGITDSDNALAIAVALSLPFAWLAFSGQLRNAVLVYGSTVIWITGSRTSLIALVALLILIFVLRRGRGEGISGTGRNQLAWLALIVSVTVGVVLPRLSLSRDALSNRGSLWNLAVERMGASPWIGFGSSGWSRLYTNEGQINAGAIYSPHNQWLEVQYAAGYLGVILFLLWLGLVIREGRANIQRTAIIIVPMLAIGITERVWSFGLPDWITWALVATCLASPRACEFGDPTTVAVRRVPIARADFAAEQ